MSQASKVVPLDAAKDVPGGDVEGLMDEIGRRAAAAQPVLAAAPADRKDRALRAAAAALRSNTDAILAENAKDVAAAKESGTAAALVDRLTLTPERIEAMAAGLEQIAELPDPVGRVLAEWDRPNGLHIRRVAVPLGVIGIIYESRPNVTADAGGLCLKSGNACILRGGSDSLHSSAAILDCLQAGLREAGLPAESVQRVPTADRAAVGALLRLDKWVDLIVPRGGKGLIARVQAESRIPVLAHLDGNCHVYVHEAADLEMAKQILLNAKLRRTGICGATESLLIDAKVADRMAGPLVAALLDAGCAVRGDDAVQKADPRVTPASEEDWSTEYLDAIISAKVVPDLDAAIAHIARYGSHHTDAIVTGDAAAAAKFLNAVDSAIVMHNASTQFADGGQFGMGAEIGIATGRLHARGPVGVEQLTTFKYQVEGDGQTRP
ncbi:glutamate-5-semialdehyde dehydrogenase [Marinibaculum pumilum]|uniref:Gamma-glutamyl phosphate reductase n=1 Tax=Marinibaculum pumilum TaxID=1766165 RepID=A0ABV7L121_9PROT